VFDLQVLDLQAYVAIKLLHLLLFVYWLGGDIGVFYSASVVRDRNLSVEGRRVALQILGWIDQIPRYCLVLTLPVGYALARQLGVTAIPDGMLLGLWCFAALWLWAVWFVHHRQGTPLAERVRKIDLYWRIVLATGLCWDALQGLRGTGHIFADWLAIKFLLFAGMIFCGVAIRLRGRDLGPALRRLFAEGSNDATEAAVRASFAKTRPFVLAIWVLLVCAAYTGVAKPTFGVAP
jgi:hypothetical protein